MSTKFLSCRSKRPVTGWTARGPRGRWCFSVLRQPFTRLTTRPIRRHVKSPAHGLLDQQQQEQEQQQVGQEVQLPGVSTMLDEGVQVEPNCLLKRSPTGSRGSRWSVIG